jgi:hypothetical protein
MAKQKASIEDLQTEIATTIGHLGTAKEQAPNEIDRLAIDAQIRDLAGKWLELDALRAATAPSAEIREAVDTLDQIDDDIEKASKEIEQIAKVIHLAAQAVGVIERILSLIGVA